MKQLIFTMIIASIVWFGAWFWNADTNINRFENWAAAQNNADTVLGYSGVDQSGFPNRYDLEISAPVLAIQGMPEISLPFVQIMRLVYVSDHWIVALANSLNVGSYQVDLTDAKASVVREDTSIRVNVEIEEIETRGVALENVFAATLWTGSETKRYVQIGSSDDINFVRIEFDPVPARQSSIMRQILDVCQPTPFSVTDVDGAILDGQILEGCALEIYEIYAPEKARAVLERVARLSPAFDPAEGFQIKDGLVMQNARPVGQAYRE